MKAFRVGLSTSTLVSFTRPRCVDGIAHYTRQLIQSLSLEGVECHGFSYSKKMVGAVRAEGLKTHVFFTHGYAYYTARSMLTGGRCCRVDPSVDIFHATDYKLMPLKVPVVATLHDAIPLIHPEWGSNRFKARLVAYFLRRNVQFAQHIITVSHHAAQDLVQYFKIQEKDISVVYNAVSNHWFEPIEQSIDRSIDQKYGLASGYILAVGTIQPRKNFSRLIDAYLTLPAAIRKEKKLVIVGKYGWSSEDLVRRMQHLQQKGELVWLSHVDSDEDLRCLYQGASVFAFPSLYEGFGIPLLEAFASRVPVLCSNITSLPEISQGAALEVNPYSIQDLAAGLEILLIDDQERAKRIQLGYDRAMQFKSRDIAKQTLAVYRRVLTEKG